MSIAPADVKKLRGETGVGVMDAKKALEETGGDFAKAVEVLRKQGQKLAAKKQDRTAAEGWIGTYTHTNGKIGAMVAVSCETDFVARSDTFQELVKHLTMHVAATDPAYLKPEDVPADVVAKERSLYEAEAKQGGKPAAVIAKIVDGKLDKYYETNCLLRQRFIMDDDKTIEALLLEAIQQLGEKIEIARFIRFSL